MYIYIYIYICIYVYTYIYDPSTRYSDELYIHTYTYLRVYIIMCMCMYIVYCILYMYSICAGTTNRGITNNRGRPSLRTETADRRPRTIERDPVGRGDKMFGRRIENDSPIAMQICKQIIFTHLSSICTPFRPLITRRISHSSQRLMRAPN